MADIDLPVFSFRYNWRDSLVERLSFLTNVLRAEEGAEQRRALRRTPRRSFDVDILLKGPERTFFDVFINRLSGSEMTVPLYWEVVAIPEGTVAGATNRIEFDTSYSEFQPGLAILMGQTALEYEVIQISAVDAGGIDLSVDVVGAWPAGTKLMPLRRGIIDDVGQPSALTADIFSVTTRFTLTVPNEWTPAVDASPVYLGLPVFLETPNWVDALTTDYTREIVKMDSETGAQYQVDTMNRVTLGQSHRWFLHGRERLASIRDLLYRHRGRAGAFWLPTFKHDLRLYNSPGSGAVQIEVDKIGYDYTDGPTSGREYIAITHDGGTIIRKVNSVIAGTTPKTERLNLDAALGLALSPGSVRRISFVDTARFDQDDFEIEHHGGLDSLHEMNAVFRTFKNTRTFATPIDYPIPVTAQNFDPCGDVEHDPCYVLDVFDGWFLMLRALIYRSDGGALASSNRGSTYLTVGNGLPDFNGASTPCLAFGSGTFSQCSRGTAISGEIWKEFRYDYDVLEAASGASLHYEHQYPFNVHETGVRLKMQYKRWTDDEWTTIMGATGSGVDATTALDGSVDLDDLFVRDNYWTMPDLVP